MGGKKDRRNESVRKKSKITNEQTEKDCFFKRKSLTTKLSLDLIRSLASLFSRTQFTFKVCFWEKIIFFFCYLVQTNQQTNRPAERKLTIRK